MPVSKKIRFNIFKRDLFTCQYCGKNPPNTILELDHITPKSKGGKESINNYITSCFDCNRGKGNRLLTNIPKPLKETLEKNLADIKERKQQIKAYNSFLEKEETQFIINANRIDTIFNNTFTDKHLSDAFIKGTIRQFFGHLPVSRVEQAMALSCSTKYYRAGEAIDYFCGICWNWIKRPETRNW